MTESADPITIALTSQVEKGGQDDEVVELVDHLDGGPDEPNQRHLEKQTGRADADEMQDLPSVVGENEPAILVEFFAWSDKSHGKYFAQVNTSLR
jgi:hypothetical protein